jgi:hypothetical protein
MDWLTFTSKIVEAVAWPFVVLLIFFGLKSKVFKLFPFLRKLKYKDFEAEFGEVVREISEKLPTTMTKETTKFIASTQSVNHREQLLKLAELAPRAAILESWLQVEHAAQRLIDRTGGADRSLRMVGPTTMRKYLDKTASLSQEQRESFNKLRDLRNKVVHLFEISLPLDEVLEYIDLALSLAEQLDAAKTSDQGNL